MRTNRYMTVATGVEDDDRARVHYSPSHVWQGQTFPANLHVTLADVNLFGTPEDVVELLSDALTQVQARLDRMAEGDEV